MRRRPIHSDENGQNTDDLRQIGILGAVYRCFVAARLRLGAQAFEACSRNETLGAMNGRTLTNPARGNSLAAGESNASSINFARPLFDSLPDALFYMKDRDRRFLCANAAMAELCGVLSADELVSKRGEDVFPTEAAEEFEFHERRVSQTRRAITDQLFSVAAPAGKAVWLLLGCWPLVENGAPSGVAGLGRILDPGGRKQQTCERVATGVRHIGRNLAARIRVQDLANHGGVSVSQIERDFIDVFGVPPTRYVARMRLDAAMDMLSGGDAIAEIAHACGYADQSAFTRRFQAALGMTPSEYRRRAIAAVRS